MSDGNYEVVLYPLTASSVMTSSYLEMFGTGGAFSADMAEYEGMLRNIRASTGNYADLRAACCAAESTLVQHAVLIPVFYQSNCFVTNKDTKDIYFYASKDYVYFGNATKK